MLVNELKSIFADWKAQDLLAAGVAFKESSDPIFDPSDDYRVTYTATFEPDTLEKASMEFWVTDTGHVAVGIETYDRIVRRLGLKAIRHGFAVGHEPRAVSKEGLQTLLNAVAMGKVVIIVRSALRLATSAKICIAKSDYDAMTHSGYPCSDWLSPIPNDDAASLSPLFGKSLSYRPW